MKSLKEYNQCNKNIACVTCVSYAECKAWLEFVLKHNDTKPYSHFGERVSLQLPSIRQYVMSPSKISTHSFYPFIHFTKNERRFGKRKRDKVRHLHYCSHLDRCVYQRYAFLLNYKYNIWAKCNGIDDVAVAYRDGLGKNNIDFAKSAFDAISGYHNCLILVGDFTDFFDNLDHNYLKKMICKVLGVTRLPDDYFAIYQNITRYSFWDWIDLVKASGDNIYDRGIRKKINNKEKILTKEQFLQNKNYISKNKTNKGIPQGSPISAVLSNIYMIEFDLRIKQYVTAHGGVYMRYSDDFIMALPYENVNQIDEYEQWFNSYISSMQKFITLQEDKTDCYLYCNNAIYDSRTGILTSINYLGFLFNGTETKIRPRAITKYYYRMRRKARTIGYCNWVTPKGRHITAKNLYSIYAMPDEKDNVRNSSKSSKYKGNQTFITYARRARRILRLTDSEADSLIKNYKRKIAKAIKEGYEKC